MTRLKFSLMDELHRQLLLSPPDVRRKHADRLEQLLLSLEPDRTYPYEFIFFRATGFRSTTETAQVFPGRELMADLHVMLESVSASAPREAAGVGEQVHTVEEVAAMLGVTVRTVHRWRRRGLVAMRYVFPDGQERVGVRESAIERFRQIHGDRLEKSRSFSRISRPEERRILELASGYRRAGMSLTEAAGRVGQDVGRSRESIRLLLQRHGRDHPDDELLAAGRGRIESDARARIYAEYRRDVPVEELCRRFQRSRSSIYRIINQEGAKEVLRQSAECFFEEDFEAADFEQRELGAHWRVLMARLEGDAGPHALGVTLPPDEEGLLFRTYNYTKYLLAEGQARLNPKRYVSGPLVRHLGDLSDRAERIEKVLLRVHLPLVERVANQHTGQGVALDELRAEGRTALRDAVRSFDYRGGRRFRPHLTLDLQKRFARLLSEAGTGG